MPLAAEPFSRVGMDIIGPMNPMSEGGYRYVLVMVDYTTRYPEATPLKNIRAETVAEAAFDMWTRTGIPESVLTDKGSQFTGQVMKEVYRLLAIKGQYTTPYHAQCNGLVERFNGTLKRMLRSLVQDKPKQWDRWIPALLFAYREVPQSSTGFSPFELLYEQCEQAFQSLKRVFCEPPVCNLPVSGRRFVLQTDASENGIGAMLCQEYEDGLRPVSCASKKLKPAELNYPIIEKECLAMVWGIQHF
ncbi:hypothetical protein ACOMHN_011122 [Nucella lapillus]